MDRITQGYIESFAKSFEINEAIDPAKLFEIFASYSVVAHEYNESFSIDSVVVGDSDDCGIDGIAIIANGIYINTIEELEDIYAEYNTISDVRFILVQAKTSSNFEGAEIATFGFGVKDLFSREPQLKQNEQIRQKAQIISYIYNNAVKLKSKPECVLYFVTTGKWVDDENLLARINGVISDLREENIFSKIQFIPTDADKLQKYYKETIDVVERIIELQRRIPLPEMDNIEEAYLAILPARQYLSLITNEDNLLKSVLYDNIRDYQGDQNTVNSEIASTLASQDANKFVVLNNGITIICKSLRNIVRDKFLLSGYQIVNGCQTSHVLYKNREKVDDNIYITVKVISTTHGETINKIIKATNRQTTVSDEQLMALTEFQKKLEAFYSTFSGAQRLFYERRSRQYADDPNIEKVRVVSVQYQIKAFASMFLDKPHLASRYYGRLLKETTGIFDEDHQLLPYYTSTYLLYRIEFLIRNKQIEKSINKYRYHFLMAIKYLILNPSKQPPLNSHAIERLCEKILKVANDNTQLLAYINEAKRIIEGVISDWNNEDDAKTMTVVDAIKSSINIEYR